MDLLSDIQDVLGICLIVQIIVLLSSLLFKLVYKSFYDSDFYLDSDKKEIDFSFLEGDE